MCFVYLSYKDKGHMICGFPVATASIDLHCALDSFLAEVNPLSWCALDIFGYWILADCCFIAFKHCLSLSITQC